jgi:hypothetical protein
MSQDLNFAYLFCPPDTNLLDLSQGTLGRYPASELGLSFPMDAHLGLVRATEQASRAFFLSCMSTGLNPDGDEQIEVTPFPRRKNFLKPVDADANEGAAYTAKHCFPVKDCTIDELPARCAVLAALIPSIMHNVDLALTAQLLQEDVLFTVSFDNTGVLTEAMCAPSANEILDYNRLEFLGDAM